MIHHVPTRARQDALLAGALRPLLHGIILWLIVGTASLLAIRAGWISI